MQRGLYLYWGQSRGHCQLQSYRFGITISVMVRILGLRSGKVLLIHPFQPFPTIFVIFQLCQWKIEIMYKVSIEKFVGIAILPLAQPVQDWYERLFRGRLCFIQFSKDPLIWINLDTSLSYKIYWIFNRGAHFKIMQWPNGINHNLVMVIKSIICIHTYCTS